METSVEQKGRTYTVDFTPGLTICGHRSKVYKGFNKDFSPVGLEHVMLVTVDGELDVYAVDHPKEGSGLLEYLANQAGVVELLGCYSRK